MPRIPDLTEHTPPGETVQLAASAQHMPLSAWVGFTAMFVAVTSAFVALDVAWIVSGAVAGGTAGLVSGAMTSRWVIAVTERSIVLIPRATWTNALAGPAEVASRPQPASVDGRTVSYGSHELTIYKHAAEIARLMRAAPTVEQEASPAA